MENNDITYLLREEKRLEAQRKAEAEELVIKLSGESEATKKKGVRSDVKAELKEAKNALSLKLDDIESLQQNAEQSLVLANQYRIKFYDVRNSLLTAEKAFFEGDFSRTSDVTISIFKKINPEAKR